MTDTPPAPTQQRSKLSRRWTLKMAIIAVLLIGFGFWGLYDATIRYPARGSDAAEYCEYRFLQQLADDHREFQYQTAIGDPAAGGRGILARHHELEAMDAAKLSSADVRLKEWLDQLRIIGKLDDASTRIPRTDFRLDDKGSPVQVADFTQRLNALRASWTTAARSAPPPLSRNDIHMQWIIVAVGLGVGGWLLVLIVMARSRVYRWDAATQALTLPDGSVLVPGDIAEFDKRKWHRLFITLKVKPSHPQLGGKDVELDLLRYEPVEDWVLAMERTAFPESMKASEKAAPPAEPATP